MESGIRIADYHHYLTLLDDEKDAKKHEEAKCKIYSFVTDFGVSLYEKMKNEDQYDASEDEKDRLKLFSKAVMKLVTFPKKSQDDFGQMTLVVNVVIPILSCFNEEGRETLANEYSVMAASNKQFRHVICCAVIQNINNFSLPILAAVLDCLARNAIETRGTDKLEEFMDLVCFVAETCQNMSGNYSSKVAYIFDELQRNLFNDQVKESHTGSILGLYSTALSVTRVEKDLAKMEEKLKAFRLTNMEGTTFNLFLAAKFTIDPVCKLAIEHNKDIIFQSMPLPTMVNVLEWFQQLSNNFCKTDSSKEAHQAVKGALFYIKIALYVLKFAESERVTLEDIAEAEVEQASDLIDAIGTMLKIGINLREVGKEKQATYLFHLCCQKAWDQVLVLCKTFKSKEDGVLKILIDNLVTLACRSSASMLPPSSQTDGTQISKIILDNLCSWSEAWKFYDKIRHPIPLIDLWIQNQCNDKQHIRARDRTIYSWMKSSKPNFQHEAVCILTHLEYQRYEELNLLDSKFCKQMQTILGQILFKDLRGTEYILSESRRLIEDARRLRARGVDSLSECETSLSKALKMSESLYMNKDSNLSGDNKQQIKSQLAQAYALRALCTQERDPNSKRLISDITHALDLWCVEHTATPSQKNATLLYYMHDLLQVKGNTSHHTEIYENMIKLYSVKNADLKKNCVTLWESRRITHDLCGSTICQDFLTKLPKDSECRTRVDVWKEDMEEINRVGYEHKLSIPASLSSDDKTHKDHISINQVIRVAKDLIKSDPESSHHQFIVAHTYYDLAQTLIGKGAMVEALLIAKEAIKLRSGLVKKMFRVIERKNTIYTGNLSSSSSYFEILPEAATEVWLNNGDDITLMGDRGNVSSSSCAILPEVATETRSHDVAENIILTPWIILECYLLSILQCALLEKNAINVERYLEDGKRISSKFGLPIFMFRFSCAFANFITKMQLKDNTLAKKELIFAEKIFNDNKMNISCLKCKSILDICLKKEFGDLHKTTDHINDALASYNSGVDMLKNPIWENEFSSPKNVTGERTTLCNEAESMGRDCEHHDEECLHCQPSRIRKSGSLLDVVYMKNEFIRRHLLSELLERIGECYRAKQDFNGEEKVLLERLSLLLSRKTLQNNGATDAREFITTIPDKRLKVFGFSSDYAAVLYETCCFFLRNPSELQLSKTKMVSALKTAFTLSQHVPTLNQKISRLLAALYYEEKDEISTKENGLSINHLISYFHQASVGTHFNSRVYARMRKNFQDPIDVDYIEQNLDERVLKFFSELPDVPAVCVSMYRDDANLLKHLLPPSGKSVWIQLSRLRVNKVPKVCIMPIESVITGTEFVLHKYSLPITKPRNITIVDELVPIFSSVRRQRALLGKMDPRKQRDWRNMLNHYLSRILIDLETTWFQNQKDIILGDLEGEPQHRTPIILVVDSELQKIPFESMPLLETEEVYRMPSVMSIISTLELSRHLRETDGGFPEVTLESVYYLLSPEGDPGLKGMEKELLPLLDDFKGLRNEFPRKEDLNKLLEKHEIFLYEGHGNGLIRMSTDKLLVLERCAAMFLSACSTGVLEPRGSYEPWGAIAYVLFVLWLAFNNILSLGYK